MGFDARQIDAMSLWEFRMQVDGFSDFHGGEQKAPPPSEDEHDELLAKYG